MYAPLFNCALSHCMHHFLLLWEVFKGDSLRFSLAPMKKDMSEGSPLVGQAPNFRASTQVIASELEQLFAKRGSVDPSPSSTDRNRSNPLLSPAPSEDSIGGHTSSSSSNSVLPGGVTSNRLVQTRRAMPKRALPKGGDMATALLSEDRSVASEFLDKSMSPSSPKPGSKRAPPPPPPPRKRQ